MTQTTPTGVDLRSVAEPAFYAWFHEHPDATPYEAWMACWPRSAKWMLRASAQFGGIVPLLHRFIGLLESDEVSRSERIEIK